MVACGAPTSPSGILKPNRYSLRQRQRKDGELSFAEIETSAAASWLTQSLPKGSETTSAFELDLVSASTTQASGTSAQNSEVHPTEQPDTTLVSVEAPPKDQPVASVAHFWFSLEDLEAKIKQLNEEKPLHKPVLDFEEVQSADEGDEDDEGLPVEDDVPTRVRPGEFLLWEPEEYMDFAAEDVAYCTAGNAVEVGLRDFLAEAWLDTEYNNFFLQEEEV